eukprot:CAMPEP_0201594722 /NCGR_PEP_ID=MMETSP0190_2-20130828/191949_1 /ASSEMBLY_ACC=CAM_ASM_000263 /TAXON_ID=37353 /ORGANISM="Rosalina sp." /LENGTH=426 /DNA_ID=CAMNT_0048054437 /DNA_START=19 /DNA_END=1300 /DNA_ORIENTATION=+
MSSKKKTAKKGKGDKKGTAKKGKGKGKKNEEIEELRTMLEALKKEMDSMHKTIKKQGKRITSLETENKRMKKNIQKMQLNGGGGGDNLLSPRESSTAPSNIPSDIEPSDTESKDNDDSKLNEKEPAKKKEDKPKPVEEEIEQNQNVKQKILSGGDNLLSPRESSTAPSNIPSDIEPSDTESKDNDDSKLNEKESAKKKEDKPKPKPVARRNRAKPKRKAEDIKFTFDMSHQKIKAVENGMAALKPKTYGGTIRFGRFTHFTKNNNDNLASFIITFDTRSIGSNSSTAFGWATTSFSGWVGSNFGQNNSCVVKGNAQVLWTDKVYKYVDGKEYKHKQMCNDLKAADNPKDGFFKEGQDVSVQIDLKNKIGRVWNETLNKDGEDKTKVFEAILPDDYEICVCVYMGGAAKKRLTVKDQKFKFDEEEAE